METEVTATDPEMYNDLVGLYGKPSGDNRAEYVWEGGHASLRWDSHGLLQPDELVFQGRADNREVIASLMHVLDEEGYRVL